MTSAPYQLGLYEKAMPDLSWSEKLRHAKDAGFDYLEISIDESDEKLARLEWAPAQRRELLMQSQDAGLPIQSMCLSGHRKFPFGSRHPETRTRSLEIMEQALELANDLGIRYIQLAGYDVYYEQGGTDTITHFTKNLARATEMATAAGVVLGFETMETPFMDTTRKALSWVKQIDSPYLQIYPDVGNITNSALLYGGDPNEDLQAARGHLIAAHLKETVPGKYREIPFATGHVDFPRITQTLWSLGVRRYVAEFWYTGSPRWTADLVWNCRYLRDFLDSQTAE